MTDSRTLSNEAGTVQKQAETSLRDAAWRLQSIIEGTHVGTWEWNIQTGQTVYNNVWAQIIGYTLDELTPISVKTFETFVHPDDLRHSDELLQRHFAGELPYYDYDCRMKHKDGHWVWVHDRGRVITRTEDGKPLMMFGTHTDITERKQAEEALRESDERYSLINNASRDSIYSYDTLGRFTSANRSLCELLKLEASEIIGHTHAELGFPDAQCKEWDSLHRRVYETDNTVTSETTAPMPDGTTHNFEVVLNPLHDSNGIIVGIGGTTRDITERKQTEEKLRNTNDLFSLFMRHSPIYTYIKAVTPTESRVLQASDNYLQMIGVQGLEMVGKTMAELFPAELAAKITADDWGVVSRGEILSVDEDLDGRNYTSIKFPIVQGSKTVLAGYTIDITELKQAEEEKQALQARLLQSQKMEAIGTLAGGVAHDFNNLLTGILGNIALMRASLPPENPLLENLNAAETAARRAADLTKGLLTYSRNAIVMPVVLDVDMAVGETLDLLRQSLPATITIVRNFQPDAWSILADRSQLTQILLNLAVNARDAMDGRGTLTISVHNEVVDEEYLLHYPFARAGEFVHLRVSDTGPGLPDVIVQHLFEPFYTTKPVGSGTGLGLSIVYGAVKQAGGWITAVSTQGTGTTFDIFLPRSASPVDPVHIPEPVVENTHHGMILVVEDEPVISTVAQTLLSRSGYTVLTAPDGASALDILQHHPVGIRLILLDMTMPGMTTAEIVQAIRDMDPKVPILLNSGYTSNDSVQHMLEEGSVQGFLGKPYDLQHLLENVEELLRGS
ncbi:MAG: PAS domain S-box protein [Caldiserica bacterium]|nr:PAS domain S-box protein [Caldisericota bacterium]